MRDLTLGRIAPIAAAFVMVWGMTRSAAAQAPAAPPPQAAPAQAAPAPAQGAPAAPPAGYPYPPPPPGYGYGYPYPPPPGYAYPGYAPTYQRRPPDVLPYQGGPVPSGYHLEERPRKGLIISGALLTGVPWAIGLAAVSGSNFPNSSGWLVVPALGPWLTLAARHDNRCSSNDYCYDDGLNSAARTMLVLDGLVQTAGAVMFVVGIASPAKVVARDLSYNLHFTPAMMGRLGYGGFLTGEF